MKNKLIIVASVLALILVAWACAETLLELKTNERTIPEVSNADPIKYNQTYLQGTVEIRATAMETVINLKDITSSSNNDLYSRVFVLQQRSNNKKFGSDVKNEKAELLFFKWGLIVALKTGEHYLFVLGNNDELNPEAQSFLEKNYKAFKLDGTYYGFGLAVMLREISDLKKYLKERTTTFYNTDEEIKKMGLKLREEPAECANCSNLLRCQAGGFGASSCSYDGSSVQCDHPPCNACCTGGDAKCCSEETTPD